MYFTTAVVGIAFIAHAIAAPERVEKRQGVSDLLVLASEAGITLPTNPAALLSLGPAANQLASALPTAPVLSVLLTAAPSGFLSEIVHNPSFASSFESAFAAGSSPSWFNALPTDVRSYLHTYSGYAGIATAAAEIENGNATSGITGVSTGSAVNETNSGSSVTITSSGGTSSTPATSAGTNSVSSSGASNPASSTSNAGAPSQTGVLAAGIVGAVGILGLALAL